MTVGFLILAVFVLFAVLMFLRKLPAILALPLMATAIAAIEVIHGRLSMYDAAYAVIADGSLRLAEPMIISMFGGMLSVLMQKAGVAESFVRRGAELSGDNPLVVAIIMLGIIALLFTTIGGLGAVIMVGTIVLPILASIGVREHVGAGIVLFGIALGGIVNPNNWAMYRTVLMLDTPTISSFALIVFLIIAIVAVAYIAIELLRSRALRLRRKGFLNLLKISGQTLIAAAGLYYVGSWIGSFTLLVTAQMLLSIVGAWALVSAIRDYYVYRNSTIPPPVRWYAYLIPVIPLLLILLFEMHFVTAFICGLVYGIIVTYRRGSVNMASRAVIEGSASVVPALVLMVGIGMLLSAILGPTRSGPGAYWFEHAAADGFNPGQWPVLADMTPLLEAVVPASMLSYVIIFTLLGPLALYRGPLNVWGLGYGVGGVLLATGVPAGAIMGILMSVGMIQSISDPTNTQNVWLANEQRIDVNVILWKTLPYSWLIAVLGLIAAGLRFY